MSDCGAGAVTIASDVLRVTVNPRVGGTITAVTHLGLGLSVLGTVPWDPVDAPIAGLAARDEAHWLTRYTGGWPLLFPNGGDAGIVDGIFHGFHGEASIASWGAAASPARLVLRRRFFTVPVDMHRELTVEGDLLIVRETLRMTGPAPVDVMWGHHPTFGSDLLAGPFEVTTGAGHVVADEAYDPAANPLVPGSAGKWPVVEGKSGRFDLSRPAGPLAAMAYLHEFAAPWAAIRRLDDSIGVALSWTPERFPCAWLWYELGGTTAAPWYGRCRLVGIEPSTTPTGSGLREARRRGSALMRLEPGQEYTAEIRLHVFRPSGRISDVDPRGRALLTAA
jgi:hypothetical protein